MIHLEQLAKIEKSLKELFPTARPRFIELAFEAIALHATKNNDYNSGDDNFHISLGTLGTFHDVCRKVGRLHTFIIKKKKNMTKENLHDTAIDLAVYALLLAEELEGDQNEA